MRFTSEQTMLRDAIRDFSRRECGTREQRDAWLAQGGQGHSPALYERLGDLGWLGIALPEEYGGSGGGHVEQVILFEELHRGLVPVKGIGATTTVAGCYRRFGTPEQQRSAFSTVVAGKVMAISISEPEAGSDVSAVSCSAQPTDGGFVINGQKTWCSYAHIAERYLLLARTERGDKAHNGLTMLEVPADSEGITTRRIETMGHSEVNDVFFSDVFVPASNVVGTPGRGFQQMMAGLDGERLLGAAVGLGWGARALEDLLSYVKDRRQFGQTIGSFQVVRHRIADLATELECARLLTYEVAQLMDEGADPALLTRLTSMAKVKTSETARQIALEGVQLMGGYGYSTEFDMESHLRNTVLLPIYAGTNEIQREIISGSMGLG